MANVPANEGKRAKAADKPENIEETQGDEIDAKDAAFIIGCLKAAVEGKILINIDEAAINNGMKNPGSVRNKLAVITKKYGINIGTTTRTRDEAAAATEGGAVTAAKPKPAKSKKRAASEMQDEDGLDVKPVKATRARATKKAKVVKHESGSEDADAEETEA